MPIFTAIPVILKPILHNFFYYFSGVQEMKTWSELPQILEQDMREVEEVDGKGLRVLESVIQCLRVDYDLFYTKEDLIHKVTEEMLTNPNQF